MADRGTIPRFTLGFECVAEDPQHTLPWSHYATEIDAAALGSRFVTPVGMSPAEDTACCLVSVTRHHDSRRSSRAFPVDEQIYVPASCAIDEVCNILAVHEHNE